MNNIHQRHILKIAERYRINIQDWNNEVDIILGHSSHMLMGYKRDNIQMIGGWYVHNTELDIKFLLEVIKKYNIKIINFIGASKSCSGAVLLTKGLIEKGYKKIQINLFLFSAYTTIDKLVYIKRNLEDRAPGSLKNLWDSKYYTPELIQKMEMRRLKSFKNVNVYLFFPGKSKYGEKQLAYRLKADNFFHIEIPVHMHNTLYPFWKEVQENKTIEIYEGEIKKMHIKDYNFYKQMQQYTYYNFTLYNCLQDVDKFSDELHQFIDNYKL